MTYVPRAMRLGAVLALSSLLSGCGLIPPEGPSQLAQRPKIDSGPSSQRLGPDGYPLLGAFPRSAATQLPDATVAAERGQLQADARTQNTAAVSTAGEYQRSVAEAQAAQAATRSEVDSAVATGRTPDAGAAATDAEDVLRTIEGR